MTAIVVTRSIAPAVFPAPELAVVLTSLIGERFSLPFGE